jgi:hypothetical protein
MNAALRYADLGYAVFPCAPGGKSPLTGRGFLDASCDPDQIERWWSDHPAANIGLPTQGMLVVDVDPVNNGPNPWLAQEPEKQFDLATAPIAATPRGGRHYFFRQPPGRSWRCTEGRIAPRVDTRADGGYVVVPPSVRADGHAYTWAPSLPLEVSADRLPEPPAWLAGLLEDQPPPADRDATTGGNLIPEGQRNATLARLAGAMRRVGMTQAEIAAALRAANAGRCRPPVPDREVERIAASVARYEPDQVATAVAEGHWDQMEQAAAPQFVTVRRLVADHPAMREPVVHGLLRRGETMNLISAAKIGKSWLSLDLALSVVAGLPWLGTFGCERGEVLLVDNELHPETLADRIPRVARAKGIPVDQYADRLCVRTLRGGLQNLLAMGGYFRSIERCRFKLIICDAFYRFLPPGTDENDNGAMANLYNLLDAYAEATGACFVVIHHSTKGNQSLKSVMDVGAGAGSQGRAADSHVVLRRHEEEDVVVMEGETRSWPRFAASCLRREFPLWVPAPELDPSQLRSERPKRSADADRWTPEQFAACFVRPEPLLRDGVIAAAVAQGLAEWRATKLLRQAEASGLVFRWSSGRNRPSAFASVPQPQEPEAKDEQRL